MTIHMNFVDCVLFFASLPIGLMLGIGVAILFVRLSFSAGDFLRRTMNPDGDDDADDECETSVSLTVTVKRPGDTDDVAEPVARGYAPAADEF